MLVLWRRKQSQNLHLCNRRSRAYNATVVLSTVDTPAVRKRTLTWLMRFWNRLVDSLGQTFVHWKFRIQNSIHLICNQPVNRYHSIKWFKCHEQLLLMNWVYSQLPWPGYWLMIIIMNWLSLALWRLMMINWVLYNMFHYHNNPVGDFWAAPPKTGGDGQENPNRL